MCSSLISSLVYTLFAIIFNSFLLRQVRTIYLFIYLYGYLSVELFWTASENDNPTAFFCIEKVPKLSKFFSVSRFILKRISVILLSRIFEIGTLRFQIDTSFGAIHRTTHNDCPKALFTVISTFATQVVVCSSACFGIDE